MLTVTSHGSQHMAHGTWLTAESLKLWERSTPKSLKILDQRWDSSPYFSRYDDGAT